MLSLSNRRIVKKVVKKNKRAEKLVKRGKYNRALSMMHDALTMIEENIGLTNIALAKQHIKLARFRIREAKRAQYEVTLQICNAELDRVKLSRSYAGRLVLRKLSKRDNPGTNVLTCSELFGFLHIAEATFHADRALEILQQSPNGHYDLYRDAAFLANKLYHFFEIPHALKSLSNHCNLPTEITEDPSPPYDAEKTKAGRLNLPLSHTPFRLAS